VKPTVQQPILKHIASKRPELTPKGRILADYITANPRKAVFMTTRALAETCEVSEATVVRFVVKLGFDGYGDLQRALRQLVDTQLNLLDRMDLTEPGGGGDRFRQTVSREIDNLKELFEALDTPSLAPVIAALDQSPAVYVIGARLSYSPAYYLGWSLTKVRSGIHILKGSDRTTIDWLTIAPDDSLAVLVATTRYPNELIQMGRFARRLGLGLVVLADSSACPLLQFADHQVVVPARHIPYIGSTTTLTCLINYLVHELARHRGKAVKRHQERLETAYLENDVLFNVAKAWR
jgi:DNA-binding MurR/RpiR family transcriptional regulator